MTIAFAAASIALITAVCPAASAQLSMGRPGTASAQAERKRPAGPAKAEKGLTPQEQARLAELMNRMTPQDRERLAKAVKRLTPEQRAQLIQVLKRRLEKPGPSLPLAMRAR
jgi:hypothetical protein